MFTLYPKRTVLCFSLFVGQAFLYNAFFFTYGDTLTTFLGVGADRLLHRGLRGQQLRSARCCSSPLFDSRRPGPDDHRHLHRCPGVLLGVAGFMLGDLTAMTLTVFGVVIFFFASAGASAAYLTASEVFPMETRALCIAFFYADRHGGGRHHRPAAVRQADRQRVRERGHHRHRARLLPRRRR